MPTMNQLTLPHINCHKKQRNVLRHIAGLVQKRRNSIANTLELRLSCTNPLTLPHINCHKIQRNVLRHIAGLVKKDVTPLLTHWSYVFLALTHWHYPILTVTRYRGMSWDISLGWYKKDVTPLLTHWSYVFLALTHWHYPILTVTRYRGMSWDISLGWYKTDIELRLPRINPLIYCQSYILNANLVFTVPADALAVNASPSAGTMLTTQLETCFCWVSLDMNDKFCIILCWPDR